MYFSVLMADKTLFSLVTGNQAIYKYQTEVWYKTSGLGFLCAFYPK